jgi:hypothetical protein
VWGRQCFTPPLAPFCFAPSRHANLTSPQTTNHMTNYNRLKFILGKKKKKRQRKKKKTLDIMESEDEIGKEDKTPQV